MRPADHSPTGPSSPAVVIAPSWPARLPLSWLVSPYHPWRFFYNCAVSSESVSFKDFVNIQQLPSVSPLSTDILLPPHGFAAAEALLSVSGSKQAARPESSTQHPWLRDYQPFWPAVARDGDAGRQGVHPNRPIIPRSELPINTVQACDSHGPLADAGFQLVPVQVGSSTGQKEFIGSNNQYQPYTDFGAGDLPLSAEQYQELKAAGHNVLQIPFLIGAVSVFHDIPGMPLCCSA